MGRCELHKNPHRIHIIYKSFYSSACLYFLNKLRGKDMSRRKIFLYVIVSLIAVAVLVAGGYAIYRLGVAHGAEGTSSLTFDRRFVPDFDRKSVPDLWHWRGHVSFPFFSLFPGLISGLAFVAVIALAIYGGVKLLWPGSGNGRKVADSQPPQPADPVDNTPSVE
jgi:hypothetical protein